jgi:hypothetical protein
LVYFALSVVSDSSQGFSSFSDGPLRISGRQLITSIVKPERSDPSVSRWKCQADGTTKLGFGDIVASADGMTVTQLDGERYGFVLTGNSELQIRGLSAKASKISWAMDDRPMVLSGDARITVVIDGKPSTFAADTITFDGTNNTLQLSDGTTKQLPVSKVNALVIPR